MCSVTFNSSSLDTTIWKMIMKLLPRSRFIMTITIVSAETVMPEMLS